MKSNQHIYFFLKAESKLSPACLYSVALKSLTLRQLEVNLTLFTLLPLPFDLLPMTIG